MLTHSPQALQDRQPHVVDLLVVGGLTVDYFADGSSAAGGSVVHASRAARAAGLRVGVVTLAGNEPEARDGLRELGELATVHAVHVPASIGFRHYEQGGHRVLVLTQRGSPLTCPTCALQPRAVLYAPVAAEIGAGLADQVYPGAATAAILQGWLRTLDQGKPVRPTRLAGLDPALVEPLRTFDLLVASREDLAAVAAEPGDQLDQLRATFGPRPLLAVTGGPSGAWLDNGDRPRWHVAPERVITGTPTTGAGDVFAAILAAQLARGVDAAAAAEAGTAAAVAYLARQPS
jgi:sugar/nucleoside kinase (ribokinase family)